MKFFVVCFWFSLAAIVLGSPTKAMVGGRNILAEPTERMPYDAEVEYLESTGTQYIDTGIIPTIDTSAELDVMEVSWVGWAVMLGSATSDNNADSWYFRTGGAGPEYSFRIDGKAIDNAINVPIGIRFMASVNKAFMSVAGITKVVGATAYSSTPTLSLWLFACNLNGRAWTNRLYKGRIYSCRIYDAGTIMRDFQAVRFTNELGQSEGAMYDRVSGQFFLNAGTGAFIIGPDKH